MQVVFRLKYKKKNQFLSKLVLLAGALGLEPRTKVLETHVLPLHHAPKHLHSIAWRLPFVNAF